MKIERGEKSKSSSAVLFLQSWKTSFVVPSVPDAGGKNSSPAASAATSTRASCTVSIGVGGGGGFVVFGHTI